MNPLRLAPFCCFLVVFPVSAQDGLVFKSDARLVEVYASVLDQKGHYLDGLTRDRFNLTDDGAAQPIVAFENEAKEVSCAILLDTTASMARALPTVKNAVVHLIDDLREGDSAVVYGFDSSVRILQDFTQDKRALKQSVVRLRASGTTALFDAIAQVAAEISTRGGKKAIIVFTDGGDNASMLNLESATTRAKKVGVPIYSVAQGEALSEAALLRQLHSISDFTNGLAYEVRRVQDVEKIFEDISSDLQHTYMLAYKPPMVAQKKWRAIQVSVNGLKTYKVRAREGYLPE